MTDDRLYKAIKRVEELGRWYRETLSTTTSVNDERLVLNQLRAAITRLAVVLEERAAVLAKRGG